MASESSGSIVIPTLYHLALPPHLPCKEAARLDKIGSGIVERLTETALTLSRLEDSPSSQLWRSIWDSLEICRLLNRDGKLDRDTLLTAFEDLKRDGVELILHIAKQNTGITIRKVNDADGEGIIVEAFESAPVSEDVLSSQALLWNFPGYAVRVPDEVFQDVSFQQELATFLQTASTESIKRFAPRARDGRSYESRDTVNPALVIQVLMPLLEANGTRIVLPLLQKRVRDDVCWIDGSEKPWRRCPMWLVLRVALQRLLITTLGVEFGRCQYKLFVTLMLTRFMRDTAIEIPYNDLELLIHLKSKICRRLVKLECDKKCLPTELRVHYDAMFVQLDEEFRVTVRNVDDRIQKRWEEFKMHSLRKVKTLHRNAAAEGRPGADPLKLTLTNSLKTLLSFKVDAHNQNASSGQLVKTLPVDFDPDTAVTKPSKKFLRQFFDLSTREEYIQGQLYLSLSPSEDCGSRCMKFANNIESYLTLVRDAYDFNPEQKSVMLLIIMQLWKCMDQCAIELFPLLKEYQPMFSSSMFEPLQFSEMKNMLQTRQLQEYLQDRQASCEKYAKTIFDDPGEGCFGERYYNESPDRTKLHTLHQEILDCADRKRARKQQEWTRKMQEHRDLTNRYKEASCEEDLTLKQTGIHDRRTCAKCKMGRMLDEYKVSVRVHEHPLPENVFAARTVVFELACPAVFAKYREVTWKIISTLACPSPVTGTPPLVHLKDYSELLEFAGDEIRGNNPCISLASIAKSYLNSHWAYVKIPVEEREIYKECRLRFGYFDSKSRIWPGRPPFVQPTFAHHCKLIVPQNSPFFDFRSRFRNELPTITSYSVVATQSKCPQTLNVHEFMGYQSLLSSDSCRWLHLLAELGSFDLNFSSEATVHLVSHVSLHLGKYLGGNPLGSVHRVFQDANFCSQLLGQLTWRMNAISCNWRESNCMEIIITILLRLLSLGASKKREALLLIRKARNVTTNWILALQDECKKCSDADSMDRFSRYALWASLLCRRTFAESVLKLDPPDAATLAYYLQCTISLQDNMSGNITGIGIYLKSALIRDLKMVYQIRQLIRNSILLHPDCLVSPLRDVWQNHKEYHTGKSPQLQFLSEDKKYWLEITGNALLGTVRQVIHLNILEGHLLVMGQPLGKLPAVYRTDPLIKQLFGEQNLRTCISYLPGMTYQLSTPMNNHQVHVGSIGNGIVIKAVVGNTLLRLVDTEIFRSSLDFDLPVALIHDHVHWLNLSKRIIEFRPKSHMWHPQKVSNWQLDIRSLQACRRLGQQGQDTLVNPHSGLFKAIAAIFTDFEDSQYLMVFQPKKRPLSVYLHRLGLTFTVNVRGWLECSQLRAEINNNQDAGTWYGLKSKIVLTEIAINHKTKRSEEIPNPERKIIVSMGDVVCKRDGPHVSVTAESTGIYGIYTINVILSRLECGVEPRLLHRKAAYHALTSFPIPDPLTGRTGTEEAIHCLRSGYCQPWVPLTEFQTGELRLIARLAPPRLYYPLHLKVMQKTLWNANLTTNIQHDGFRALVASIFKKSDAMQTFSPGGGRLLPLCDGGEEHLNLRSQFRRATHERADADLGTCSIGHKSYASRHFQYDVTPTTNSVFEVVSLFKTWPSELDVDFLLAKTLEGHDALGGYSGAYNGSLLTDLLDIDLLFRWGSLVNFCCNLDLNDKYQLMFFFAVMSFGHNSEKERQVIKALFAFSMFGELKKIDSHPRPPFPTYINFKYNEVPTMDSMMQLLKPYLIPYPRDERYITEFQLSGKMLKRLQVQEKAFLDKQEKEAKLLATSLLRQWPKTVIVVQDLDEPILENIDEATNSILSEWKRLVENWKHSCYLSQVHRILATHHPKKQQDPAPATPLSSDSEILPHRNRGNEIPTLECFFSRSRLPSANIDVRNPNINGTVLCDHSISGLRIESQTTVARATPEPQVPSDSPEIKQLAAIVNGLHGTNSAVRMQYANDLRESLEAFTEMQGQKQLKQDSVPPLDFSSGIAEARAKMQRNLDTIRNIVTSDEPAIAFWMQQGGLFPSITPVTALETLRSISKLRFGEGMKEHLIRYALSITALQRLLRMQDASRKGNDQRLAEEYANNGHTNWEPVTQTDWLLLEIDSNFLIRPIQVDVATATISPQSGSNSVLQMNMGQGKTSCIMPMAAANLADGKSLVRLVIPKALLLQTAQLMHLRLGGLLGRELIHLPFSRRTPTSIVVLEKFESLHQTLNSSAGVVLALPEHLLSFQLSGQQQLSNGHIIEATRMMSLQKWFTRHCRDIIDEADSILAIRTQLIYPSGAQRTLDGHPNRWTIVEILLRQVESHLTNLKAEFEHSIELRQRPQGGLPVMSFLRKDVEEKLLELLIGDFCRGSIPVLPTDTSESNRLLVKKFISEPALSKDLVQGINDAFAEKPAVMQALHLLRGLFVYRILMMSLKKRWNVQYGLHSHREPIAVPFTAKGTPSEQAEWGHPDVAILFTCLSFYYDGLTVLQLKQALEHVLKSDDPSQIYDRFAQNSTLPASLRDWNAINVDDAVQLKDIWTHLRSTSIVVDYFLNNYVFPKHAKQFSMKLQTSGWDIPLFDVNKIESATKTVSHNRLTKQCLTTGFSGTNDWKRMLPLTINQNDLPGLWHTNAEVLTYILQERNSRCVRAQDVVGRALSETQLLHAISSLKVKDSDGQAHKIRVLIDAGAQILEMNNLELVRAWMDIDTSAQAAIYFDSDNKAMVYHRKNRGNTVPLLASSFADDLSQCLVYLDEAHTRGTDLKLPINAIGALTLGLGQTKDHTVQAAMRLRQLGTTQSIVFFAPPEVCHSIQGLLARSIHDELTSFDVVCWVVEQTCAGIEQLNPLYYAQGVDFCRRTQALLDSPELESNAVQRTAYLNSVRQIEQQSLAQLYGARKKVKADEVSLNANKKLARFMTDLQGRREAFEDSGQAVHGTALQEVEQERETQYEVEAVREVQKPVHYDPLKFVGLHRDLLIFAKTGRLPADSDAYELAFNALSRTSLGKKYKVKSGPTSGKLLVSLEFPRTVQLVDLPLDHLQRPVNWILWSTISQVAIIIIPEEAEIILPILQDASDSPVHLLSYAAPITRRMLHFGSLKYYAVPTLPANWEAPMWLKLELGIYSGRLYFDYAEYQGLCDFLGVRHKINASGANEIAQLDGAEDEDEFDDYDEEVTETVKQQKLFSHKPLSFLQEFLSVRRKGQSFEQTPMGYVCQGKYLLQSHHFFATTITTAQAEIPVSTMPAAVNGSGGPADEDPEDDYDNQAGDTLRPEDYVFDGTEVEESAVVQKAMPGGGESWSDESWSS